MQAELTDGSIVTLEKDCDCLTHTGQPADAEGMPLFMAEVGTQWTRKANQLRP